MTEESDQRDRGILTPTDRDFLRGEKEYENPETASHRRSDIRQRVLDSIADFKLLVEELEERDRERIFDATDENPYSQGLTDIVVFLCLGLDENIRPDPNDFRLPEFESELRDGLRRALLLMGYYPQEVSPDLGIRAHHETTVTHLKKSLNEKDPLYPTPQMVRLLVESREVNWDNLLEFLQEEVAPPEDNPPDGYEGADDTDR